MTCSSVTIQITPDSQPAAPSWMGEVAAFAQVLTHTDLLKTIQEEVRFVHARFGRYDLIDFGVVLIGYIVSDEPTLLAFYERLAPFSSSFMALTSFRVHSFAVKNCNSRKIRSADSCLRPLVEEIVMNFSSSW